MPVLTATSTKVAGSTMTTSFSRLLATRNTWLTGSNTIPLGSSMPEETRPAVVALTVSINSRLLVCDAVATAAYPSAGLIGLSTGSMATATGFWSIVAVLVTLGGAAAISTKLRFPGVVILPDFAFVSGMKAMAGSSSTATAVGPVQPSGAQMATVWGTFTPVSSTTEALLLPLLATTARPSRGNTATPSGLVPTEMGEPIVPTEPAGTPNWPVGGSGVSATRETVPSPE